MDEIFEKKVGDLVEEGNLVTCSATDSISTTHQKMTNAKVGSALVLEDRRAIGIVTERDFLTKVIGKDLSLDLPISEIMVANPRCLKEYESVKRAIAAMRVGGFRHLIITDARGDVRKVLSVKDIINHLCDSLEFDL